MFRKADPDHILSRGTTYVRICGAEELLSSMYLMLRRALCESDQRRCSARHVFVGSLA